jgi:hypothetical protein
MALVVSDSLSHTAEYLALQYWSQMFSRRTIAFSSGIIPLPSEALVLKMLDPIKGTIPEVRILSFFSRFPDCNIVVHMSNPIKTVVKFPSPILKLLLRLLALWKNPNS